MTDEEFAMKYQAGHSRMCEMDQVDGCQDRMLPTIAMALETGLKHPSSGGQWDALAMLNNLIFKIRRGERVCLHAGSDAIQINVKKHS